MEVKAVLESDNKRSSRHQPIRETVMKKLMTSTSSLLLQYGSCDYEWNGKKG